ncbi:MAG: hypothetical protein ACOC9J_01765 [Persicimonas sp.]
MSRPGECQQRRPLNLRHERSCIDHLLWRCDLPDGVDLARLGEALVERGCEQKGADAGLPLLLAFTPAEHRILIVLTTRRTQLRLHYQTPKDIRVAAAHDLATLLAEACEDAR